MKREIKFRLWNFKTKEWGKDGTVEWFLSDGSGPTADYYDSEHFEVTQFTGLKDANGIDIYEGDICEFDNGDRCFIDCEDWLEFFGNWIGEPQVEDQLRDFYRLTNAAIIGNVYENPELIEK